MRDFQEAAHPTQEGKVLIPPLMKIFTRPSYSRDGLDIS